MNDSDAVAKYKPDLFEAVRVTGQPCAMLDCRTPRIVPFERLQTMARWGAGVLFVCFPVGWRYKGGQR